MRGSTIGLFFASAACASSASTPTATKTAAPSADRQKLIDFADSLFGAVYAPKAFKREHRQWRPDAELDRLRALASPVNDNRAFQRGLHLLFRSPGDIHTSIDFTKSRAVWLGFAMRHTTDGYRVAWVDPTFEDLAKALPIGVKIISFDGVPVGEVVERAAKETAWDSTPKFRSRFGAWFAVLRAEREWSTVPEVGTPVSIAIETASRSRVAAATWRPVSDTPGAVPRCRHWGKSKASYLTDLGRVTWRSDADAMPAYVFEADGRSYGYLRIASYGAGGPAAVERMAEFDHTIDTFLERKVEGIVIDQLGNGGGNYVFGLTMLSRLAAEPLVAPTQQFQILDSGALAAFPAPDVVRPLVDELEPMLEGPLAYLPRDDTTLDELRTFFGFVVGPHTPPRSLTEPHYQVVRAYRYDESRGTRYLGPIVLLIDELNFSAAEYVAAAFADHQPKPRAILFGATTSGAGGDQRWYRADRVCGVAKPDGLTPCVSSEVQRAMRAQQVAGVAMTVTLGYRLRADQTLGPPIENAGIAPHRAYELTRHDLEKDFTPMKTAIVETLRSAAR